MRKIAKFTLSSNCALNKRDREEIENSKNYKENGMWISSLYNYHFNTINELESFICDDFAISLCSLNRIIKEE